MIKNAFCYITRKKTRSFIIFFILTIVLTCLYSCLSIMKSSKNLEKTLYQFSNSSLIITQKNGGYFDFNQFKDIEKIKEVSEIVLQYDGILKPININVVEGIQKVQRDDVPNEFNNIVSVEATTNTKKNILFNSGVFNIIKGRDINKQDKGKIIIHEELAKKNNLKLKDIIAFELLDNNNNNNNNNNKLFKEGYNFEIIGIFSGKKQEKFTGLSSDFSENMVFIDYTASQEILNKKDNTNLVNKIIIFANSPENTNIVNTKIKELKIDWSNYILEKDTNAFEESLESVSGVKQVITIMTYSIMLGGIIVLSLILILWLRERIYEIGILLALGVSKFKIIAQFILELIFISLPSLLCAIFIGDILLNKIASGFISQDNSILFMNNLSTNENILLNVITFIQSYSILISIIVISVIIASIMILIKKPKEILSKIS